MHLRSTWAGHQPLPALIEPRFRRIRAVGWNRVRRRAAGNPGERPLKQANVPTKKGKLTELAVNYGLNLCRDGSAPIEGMDLGNVGKALER